MVFTKIKKKLGIEGIKMTLEVPDTISIKSGIMTGQLHLSSLSDGNKILNIEVQIIEKYTRGKGAQKLIDEYAMGKIKILKSFSMNKDEIITVPFEIPFTFVPSEMDRLEEKNFITKGLVRLAKKARGVKSEYSVRAHAVVEGTALQPHDNKVIHLT